MLNGHGGTIETFLHHNPTNTSLHTKKIREFSGPHQCSADAEMKVRL